MSGLNWIHMMKAGLRGAGLQPEQFWALTPYELSIILGVEGQDPPLTRARLMELDAAHRGEFDRNE